MYLSRPPWACWMCELRGIGMGAAPPPHLRLIDLHARSNVSAAEIREHDHVGGDLNEGPPPAAR